MVNLKHNGNIEVTDGLITIDGNPIGGISFEDITYTELYNKVVNEELTPLQWYRLTDYKSVNFLNGYEIANNNPTPVDPNFNPREIYTGDTEVLLLQAISESEISSIGYSENFEGEIVEYRPYTNKIGVGWSYSNGQELPDSSILSGFDLQWDGENVFFEMPEDYPALYGYLFYFTATFDGGSYRVSQAYSPLSPNLKIIYVEYPSPPDKTTNIRVENGGSKIVLLDLTEADFLDYDVDTLFVNTYYALDDAYGEIVRRIDTIKKIDVPFDFRGIKYRRFECEIFGNITEISYTSTGSTATDDVYTINSVQYITDTVQGLNAEFKITVASGSVTEVQIFRRGRLYALGETFTIDGTLIGGTSGDDDVVITIDDINSNIGYWGQGDVFKDATTTGNYEDFPVFNYFVEGVANIKWSKSYDIDTINDNNVFSGEFGNVEFKGDVRNNTCAENFNSNTIGYDFIYNTIGDDFNNNTVGKTFDSNIIGNGFNNNIIGNDFNNNTIGDDFNNNTVGNTFDGNTIGYDFNNNTIGNGFIYNTIGNTFNNNIIGNDFDNNTIGNTFNNNIIGNDFYNNNITNSFQSNTIGISFQSNTIGNDFEINTIGNTFNNNIIGNDFNNNTIGDDFFSNDIVYSFFSNDIGNTFRLNNISATCAITDFTSGPATHVYGDYNCEIFKRTDSTLRLSFIDASDVIQYTSITT